MKLAKRDVGYTAMTVAVLVTVILAGCTDGDGTLRPDNKGEGTIMVDQTPDTLAGAGWRLTGPHIEAGTGDVTLNNVPAGEYTVSWDPLSGYVMPASAPQTLTKDDTILFTGTYAEAPGPSGDFVRIQVSTFLMGSPTSEIDSRSDETQHTVTLTTPFLISNTEVTNRRYAELAQWAYNNGYCTATSASLRDNLDGSDEELMDLDGLRCEISFDAHTFVVDSGKEEHPVVFVTWYGAVAYCDWLSLREGIERAYDHDTWQCNGNAPYEAPGYRLPTEAEWEYACRAGTETPFNTGNCLDAGTEANYNGLYPYSDCPAGPYCALTVPVGSYPANAFALHDMHGNVNELCNDRYGEYNGDEIDPVGSDTGGFRVIRGGSLYDNASVCRSARRRSAFITSSSGTLGFRPVRSTD